VRRRRPTRASDSTLSRRSPGISWFERHLSPPSARSPGVRRIPSSERSTHSPTRTSGPLPRERSNPGDYRRPRSESPAYVTPRRSQRTSTALAPAKPPRDGRGGRPIDAPTSLNSWFLSGGAMICISESRRAGSAASPSSSTPSLRARRVPWRSSEEVGVVFEDGAGSTRPPATTTPR